jgi:hypothetical protein
MWTVASKQGGHVSQPPITFRTYSYTLRTIYYYNEVVQISERDRNGEEEHWRSWSGGLGEGRAKDRGGP